MSEKREKTRDTIRGATSNIVATSKVLRRDLTAAEAILWDSLRGRKLVGLKFRRQHAVGNFILDFYCSEHNLVIEVDGDIHNKQKEHNAARTQILETYGYKVIRFRNEEIVNNLDCALQEIVAVTKAPLPKSGEGLG
jgi:very-short-patch-repair endonuclease